MACYSFWSMMSTPTFLSSSICVRVFCCWPACLVALLLHQSCHDPRVCLRSNHGFCQYGHTTEQLEQGGHKVQQPRLGSTVGPILPQVFYCSSGAWVHTHFHRHPNKLQGRTPHPPTHSLLVHPHLDILRHVQQARGPRVTVPHTKRRGNNMQQCCLCAVATSAETANNGTRLSRVSLQH